MQRVLSQPEWQSRAPWYAVKVDSTHLITNGARTSDIMDREIAYAKRAGMACWVFFLGSDGSMLNQAQAQYQHSKYKNDMPWSLGLQPINYNTERWDAHIPEWVADMQQSYYFKVLDGRPLIVFLGGSFEASYGGQQGWAAAIRRLRDAARSKGLKDPYIVAVGGSVFNATHYALFAVADAISAYNPAIASGAVVSYDTENRTVQQFWSSMAANPYHLPAIPTAITGWDGRPLKSDTPDFYKSNEGATNPSYVVSPTGVELTAHLNAAVTFVRSHVASDPAKLIFIYSWNEYAEAGSVLSPTYNPAAPSIPDDRYVKAAEAVRW
jgi:hypothetical protein